jgi:hypothetical protein
MSATRSVPMTDGAPATRSRSARWVRVAAVAAAAGIGGVIGLALFRTDPPDEVATADEAAPVTVASEAAPTSAPDPPAAVPVTLAHDPTEPAGLDVAPLRPRPPHVRLDPAGLAERFVAEWLTYPPGPEPAPALAARLADLVTPAHRLRIEQLSTAGTEQRPGSAAVLGATTPLDAPADGAATVVFRVTAWQSHDGSEVGTTAPEFWDVTLVNDPAGGWLVDGLRRVG